MNHSTKTAASWTVFLLMLMQLLPLNRINPPADSDIAVQPAVKKALKKACYDCHSNETKWQPIAYIAPFSWLTSYTVHQGRNALNFSVWNGQSDGTRLKNSPKVHEYVSQESSHYWPYYLWNPSAKLSDRESMALAAWLEDSAKEQQADTKNSEHIRRDKTL
jgi:hypothetical protein